MRTKLRERMLPDYTHGEEVFNMVSHIAGGGLGVIMAALCIIKAFINFDKVIFLEFSTAFNRLLADLSLIKFKSKKFS